MRKARTILVLCVVAWAWAGSEGLATVGGTVGLPCGSSGVVYSNLNPSVLSFQIMVNNVGQAGTGDCAVSLSWTDAEGHQQGLTLDLELATVVASSLPAGGAISWSSGSGSSVAFWWGIQVGHAVSLETQVFAQQCGSGGSVYTNLTSRSVQLDVALVNYGSCLVTFSWTDAKGEARTLTPGVDYVEGVTTSLPPGGSITWSMPAMGSAAGVATWQVEQEP